jgi:hypothetical protein
VPVVFALPAASICQQTVSYLPQSDMGIAGYAVKYQHLTDGSWFKNRQSGKRSRSAALACTVAPR